MNRRIPPLYFYRGLSAETFVERRSIDIFNAIIFAPLDVQGDVDPMEIFERVLVQGVRHFAVDAADEDVVLALLVERIEARLAARREVAEADSEPAPAAEAA